MSGLIAGLDMQIDEIIRLQGFQCGSHFIFIIGIIQARCTFHCQATQVRIISDTIDQVYSRNHCPPFHLWELIRQTFHLRTIAGTPGPNTVSRVFPFRHPLLIQRMIFQKLLRTQDKIINQISGLLRSQFCTAFGNRYILRTRHRFHQ